ncbi:MAG: uL22 family ribosomal protein [Candidatus ainarchaeum sp.]|nr:uL22 family ribosomal protein [Candidatus ainarchaeum sp.]
MYSYKFGEAPVGKARLEDIEASYKDLAEVCSNIRGKPTAQALELLQKASEGKVPILFRKYISGLAHRHELGGRPGRYPKKAAKFVLHALISAISSAKAKSLSEDLLVVHAAANKKNVYPRLAPKGKRMHSYFETARVEIVVAERVPSKKEKKEGKPESKTITQAQKPASKPVQERKIESKVAEKKPEPVQAKPETNVQTKTEAKPEVKTGPKPETKIQAEAKAENKIQAKKAGPAPKAQKKGES